MGFDERERDSAREREGMNEQLFGDLVDSQ